MNDKTDDWCPTQSGTYTAYDAEWLDVDKWREIPVTIGKSGVPQPLLHGGINSTVFLMGYSQAQAIAWGYSASAESSGQRIEVRVQAYKVVYDIKAKKIDED